VFLSDYHDLVFAVSLWPVNASIEIQLDWVGLTMPV